mgnify:CR=1 FL=1
MGTVSRNDHNVIQLKDYASQRYIPLKTQLNSTKDTNTMDGDFMRKTKINGNAISQTLKRKKTLNDDLNVGT